MRGSQKYVLPVKGLKTGKHKFTFDIDKKFFESYNKSEIKNASLSVEIELNKEPGIMELSAHFTGYMEVQCDRCLEYFKLTRNFSEKTFVKVRNTEETEDDEIIYITENEYEVKLTQYLYECIMLNMPYQILHPSDDHGNSMCNQEMLQKLDEFSIKKDTREGTSEETDPRWNQLKDLKTKK